jgi:hypothetical protein
MTKRSTTQPGLFSAGLTERHFRGGSTNAKSLAAKAESARKRRIKWLKRQHPNKKRARALARKLDKCRPKHRCLSGACPVCAQAAQELFAQTVHELTEKEKTR